MFTKTASDVVLVLGRIALGLTDLDLPDFGGGELMADGGAPSERGQRRQNGQRGQRRWFRLASLHDRLLGRRATS